MWVSSADVTEDFIGEVGREVYTAHLKWQLINALMSEISQALRHKEVCWVFFLPVASIQAGGSLPQFSSQPPQSKLFFFFLCRVVQLCLFYSNILFFPAFTLFWNQVSKSFLWLDCALWDLTLDCDFLSFFFFFIVVGFVIHCNESDMDLHVFPIPIPPPNSL